jgi:hypothetical protein
VSVYLVKKDEICWASVVVIYRWVVMWTASNVCPSGNDSVGGGKTL